MAATTEICLDHSPSLKIAAALHTMLLSTSAKIGIFFVCTIVVATPACARRVTIAGDRPAFFQTPFSQSIASPRMVEYPSTDVLSSQLGIDEGKLELFHYGLEHAPSKATVLEGIVDGGGIRLKMSW